MDLRTTVKDLAEVLAETGMSVSLSLVKLCNLHQHGKATQQEKATALKPQKSVCNYTGGYRALFLEMCTVV